MTIAEASTVALDVAKIVSSTGAVGVLAWILWWFCTRELPRRDEAHKEHTAAYRQLVREHQEDRVAAAEKYAAELQRIREQDRADRKAEREQTMALLRDLTAEIRGACKVSAGGPRTERNT